MMVYFCLSALSLYLCLLTYSQLGEFFTCFLGVLGKRAPPTPPPTRKKINVFILGFQGPLSNKGRPELLCFKPRELMEGKRGALPCGLAFCLGRAGPPLLTGDLSCFSPGGGVVPINTTGGSRASTKQAAAQPRDLELFAAHLSLYPSQLTHTWDFTSCLPTATPFPHVT